MPSTPCALCSSAAKLKQSHLIPQFVYRGLQLSGGPTCPLLCGACEDRFSRWESQFARDVFHPLVSGTPVPVKYGPWLLKFATSVCWRILENARRENLIPHDGAAGVTACLQIWGDFLRARRPDVGPHHLHLVREFAAASRVTVSAVRIDGHYACVHARMGPLILFGLIRDAGPEAWDGTRVHLEGKLKVREVGIPVRYRL